MACRYCGFSREVTRTPREIDPDILCSFGEVLADYVNSSGRSVLVSWLGGEPYQWKRLWPVSDFFANRLGLALGATTNGMALSCETERSNSIKHFDQLTISVDGLASDHDWQRGLPGSFEKLKSNTKLLRTMDIHCKLWLRANMVLTRGNVEKFGEACMELADWGFDEITFNPLGGNDRPEFYPENRLWPQQVTHFRQQLPIWRERLSRRQLTLSGTDRYLARIESTTLGNRIGFAECWPGRDFLFVDEFARVAPCSFTTTEYSVPLQQLQSADDILQLPKIFAKLRSHVASGACSDCHATHMFAKFDREEAL